MWKYIFSFISKICTNIFPGGDQSLGFSQNAALFGPVSGLPGEMHVGLGIEEALDGNAPLQKI